jgi:hypothetical protein
VIWMATIHNEGRNNTCEPNTADGHGRQQRRKDRLVTREAQVRCRVRKAKEHREHRTPIDDGSKTPWPRPPEYPRCPNEPDRNQQGENEKGRTVEAQPEQKHDRMYRQDQCRDFGILSCVVRQLSEARSRPLVRENLAGPRRQTTVPARASRRRR